MGLTRRRRVLVVAAALAVAAAGTALGPAVPAGAAEPAPATGTGLSPEVAAVPATSEELDAAEARQASVASQLERDRASLERTTLDLEGATAERTGVDGLVARRREQIAKAEANLARIRADVRAIATEWFVTGLADVQALDPALGDDERRELERQQVLAETAADGATADARFVERRLDELRGELDRLDARSGDLGDRVEDLTRRRDGLTTDVADGEAALLAAAREVELAKVNATVDGTDISTLALDAYWRAAVRLRQTDARCGMTWWILAGIGRTESAHGTYLGNRLNPDGSVTSPILGPVLDGSNGFATVRDSDGGALDGIATTDRAVGPMQFLPSTWRTVGRDGTGDGVADPQNIYDAALGAGTYLCRSGPVTDDAGMRRAYFSYNRSASYVDTVVGRAVGYRDAVPLPDAA